MNFKKKIQFLVLNIFKFLMILFLELFVFFVVLFFILKYNIKDNFIENSLLKNIYNEIDTFGSYLTLNNNEDKSTINNFNQSFTDNSINENINQNNDTSVEVKYIGTNSFKDAKVLSSNIYKIDMKEKGEFIFNNSQNSLNLIVDDVIVKDAIYVVDYIHPIVNAFCSSTYAFDNEGKMILGWGVDKDKNYYYFNNDELDIGKMCTGYKLIDEDLYYFMADGKLLTNEYTSDGYFALKDGKLVKYDNKDNELHIVDMKLKDDFQNKAFINSLNSAIDDTIQKQFDSFSTKEEKFAFTCHLMDNMIVNEMVVPNVTESGNIKYNNFTIYYDEKGNIVKDIRSLVSVNDYAVCVNRSKKIVTIYGYDENTSNYTIPIVSFPCTPNSNQTPLGIHYISNKYRWKDLFGGHFGQYSLRFNDHLLFHSVLYQNPDIYTLENNTYNGINGNSQSDGCIRLRVGDAYWMYNNLKEGTIVYIYDGVTNNPFGREYFDNINVNFDPTDPLIK